MTDTQPQLAPIGERTPEKILELLGKRFRPEAIQSRKVGGGRQVQYIPVEAVIERLNKACNTWNFRIVSRDREMMVLNRWNDATRKSEPREVQVSIVIGELTITELGSREAIGVQALDDGSGEDLLKGAASDSLKKCASLFGVRVEGVDYGFQHASSEVDPGPGVALELYGDDMLPEDDATPPGPGDRSAPQVTQGDDRGQNTGSRPQTAQRSPQRSSGASAPPPMAPPPEWEGGPVSDADYLAGKGPDAPKTYAAGELEMTERQRKLIDVLRSKLAINDTDLNEMAQQHGGAPMATLGRKGASALITQLQLIKQEKMDRSQIS